MGSVGFSMRGTISLVENPVRDNILPRFFSVVSVGINIFGAFMSPKV